MKKREVVFIVVTVLVLSCLTLGGPGDRVTKPDLYKQYETFSRIVSSIQANYVEDVETEKLFYGAYEGMLQKLDPYSAFLPPEEKENLEIETKGEFGGLGIEITLDKHGVLSVVVPLEETPAFRAGVLAGDKIIKIEGQSTKGITTREAVKKLRGLKGKPVTITVLHEDGTIEDITIIRDIIKLRSVKDPRLVDEKHKIGYIRLSQFQQNSAKDLDKAVEKLTGQGMRALVLDLRTNPGGLLTAAIEVTDRFLGKGLIVSTKGRRSRPRAYKATPGNTYDNFPLAVLVSPRSASASEILAGAIQDHKRGVIVGMRTFGKGSVQTLLRLQDGKAAIRLTTAYYYTPAGRLIHRNFNDPKQKEWGIDPDHEVKLSPKEEVALWKHWRDEHIRRARERDEGRKNNGAKPDDKKPPGKPKPDPNKTDDETDKKEKFHDRTLETAIGALKAMLIDREQAAQGAKEAAK